jgi:mono/diheme cytochrome c family protein
MRCRITESSLWGYVPVLATVLVVWIQSIAFAQAPANGDIPLNNGKEIFQAACVGCHGPDGKGQPESTLGFKPPETFPDFSDCPTTTPESDIQWKSIVSNGGLGRGFSEIMPSFKEALTAAQIDMVVGYIRSLCTDPKWPLAELNLPRPLYTEKAYPENETVFTGNVGVAGAGYASGGVIYEKRFGARNNLEFVVPFSFARNVTGTNTSSWYGGVGDIAVEYKRVAYYNRRTGSLLTGATEFTFPTGNKARGTGSGVTIIEPFVSFAQLLPKESFVQVQSGVEVPTHTDDRPRESFVRIAAGKTFRVQNGLGRAWTPIVELLNAREYQPGAKHEWDLAPQFQVTLNQRQNIRANFGVRFPLNNFNSRAIELGFYLLWDWFDGGFLEGWKGLRR